MQLERQKFLYPNHTDKITGVCVRYATDIEVDVAKKKHFHAERFVSGSRATIRERREIGAVLIIGSKPLSSKNAVSNHTSLIFTAEIWGDSIGNRICINQQNGKLFNHL